MGHIREQSPRPLLHADGDRPQAVSSRTSSVRSSRPRHPKSASRHVAMAGLLRRLRHLVRHRSFDTDLAEEMEFHCAMKQQELERAGLEPGAAAFRTRRELGSLALARDRTRDVWLPVWLQ